MIFTLHDVKKAKYWSLPFKSEITEHNVKQGKWSLHQCLISSLSGNILH